MAARSYRAVALSDRRSLTRPDGANLSFHEKCYQYERLYRVLTKQANYDMLWNMTDTQLIIIVLTGVGIILSVIFSTLLVANGTNNRIDGTNSRIDSLLKENHDNEKEILEMKGRLSHIHRDISNILARIKNLEEQKEPT